MVKADMLRNRRDFVVIVKPDMALPLSLRIFLGIMGG